MTYRIEITADSLNELAGRVLAMAAQFQTTSYEPPVIVVHHGKDEVIASDPVMPEVKQAAEKEPQLAAPSAASPSPTSNDAPVTPTAEPAPSPSEAIDYHADIVPLVLQIVQRKGRDAMTAVLDQFGVSRAPEVPSELWSELRDALKEVLAS